jgi:hypothetical protein
MAAAPSWRDLMNSDELAAYDNNEPLGSEALHDDVDPNSDGANIDLESIASPRGGNEQRLAELQSAADTLSVLDSVPLSCDGCGLGLPGRGEDRSYVYEKHKLIPYCERCFSLVELPQLATIQRSKVDREIWRLRGEGLKHAQIQTRLAQGGIRRSQGMISKVLSSG